MKSQSSTKKWQIIKSVRNSRTYQPRCGKEFQVCLMEAGCFCPCPQHESEGSRSVGSIYSATRRGAVIRQTEGDQAHWLSGTSGMTFNTFTDRIFFWHLFFKFYSFVLWLQSFIKCIFFVSGLITGIRGSLYFRFNHQLQQHHFYGWIITNCLLSVSIHTSNFCWFKKKKRSPTKDIISSNLLVFGINHGFNTCAIIQHHFTS